MDRMKIGKISTTKWWLFNNKVEILKRNDFILTQVLLFCVIFFYKINFLFIDQVFFIIL